MKAWDWISGLVGNKTKAGIFLFIVAVVVISKCSYAGELHLEGGATAIHGYGPYLGFYYSFADPAKNISFETGIQMYGQVKYEGDIIGNNWAPSVMMDINHGPLSLGVGFVYLQNEDILDGSHLNITLKARYAPSRNWAIAIRHISNAGTISHNTGRNVLLLDWRLR